MPSLAGTWPGGEFPAGPWFVLHRASRRFFSRHRVGYFPILISTSGWLFDTSKGCIQYRRIPRIHSGWVFSFARVHEVTTVASRAKLSIRTRHRRRLTRVPRRPTRTLLPA